MNIDKAKDLIGGLYSISLDCICEDMIFHPVRIVEASKSIIGINPHDPEIKLLDYCERYISSYEHKEVKTDFLGIEMPSVVTFLDLELSMLDKNKKKSYDNLYCLSRVSDGTQILEFLLEFSLKYCSNSFLLIWAIYRMHLFLGLDDVFKSLLVCVQKILNDINVKRLGKRSDIDIHLKEYVLDKNSFKYFHTLYRIGKDSFVRESKIKPLVLSVMKDNFSFSNKSADLVSNEDYKETGRQWILNYFSEIDAVDINEELVLNMDAARGVDKILDDQNSRIVWSRLKKII